MIAYNSRQVLAHTFIKCFNHIPRSSQLGLHMRAIENSLFWLKLGNLHCTAEWQSAVFFNFDFSIADFKGKIQHILSMKTYSKCAADLCSYVLWLTGQVCLHHSQYVDPIYPQSSSSMHVLHGCFRGCCRYFWQYYLLPQIHLIQQAVEAVMNFRSACMPHPIN